MTSTYLMMALCVVLPAFSSGTKEGDFRAVEGRESWDYSYDISSFAPGKYNIIIQGRDRAGNAAVAGPFNVYVDPKSDLPIAGISSPTPGQRAGGEVSVVGTCVDDDGVARVEVSLDGGEYMPAQGTAFWSIALPTASLPDGPHTVSARGVDVGGVTGSAVSVPFNLDTKKPRIRMTSHESGTLASAAITLSGTVEDENGVQSLSWSSGSAGPYAPLSLSAGPDRRNARFSLSVDTRRVADGPQVYWFKARDLTGSEGTTAFLFFVDNTGPALQILRPLPADKVSGIVTVVGKIVEKIGVKSFSFDAGEAGKGDISLTPGDPYWVQDLDFTRAKGGSARVVFTVVDLAGNRTVAPLTLSFLPDEADLPVVTVRSPRAAGRYPGSILLAGSVRDDDGVKAVMYALDGKAPQTMDAAEAFSIQLTGMAAGRHTLAVRGVDVNGRQGKDVVIPFLCTGAAPVIALESVVTGKASAPFRPGHEISRDAGAVLLARIDTAARIQGIEAQFGGSPAAKPALRPAEAAGRLFAEVRVPPLVPFGLVPVNITVTDEYGQSAALSSLIHVTNASRRGIEAGILMDDPRIQADGSVTITGEAPLRGILAEEDIQSVSLEPPTSLLTVTFEGERFTVTPASVGISPAVSVKIVSARKHVFSSPPLRFITDLTGPALSITTPRPGQWFSGGLALEGSAEDETGIASVELSMDGGRGFTPIPVTVGGKHVEFRQTLAMEAMADGPVDLVVRVTDTAGNSSLAPLVVLKDTTAPSIRFLTPQDGEETGGTTLVSYGVSDAGRLAKVEMSTDGSTYTPAEGRGLYTAVMDAAALGRTPDRVWVRAADAAGNAATAELALRMSPGREQAQAAGGKDTEKPVLEVLSPARDTPVSGAVLFIGRVTDNQGIKRLGWDAGGPRRGAVELPAGSPSWLARVDFSGEKASRPAVSFTAEDLSGNKTEVKFGIVVDPAADEPAVTILQPAAKARLPGSVLLTGTARDPDGIGGLFYALDGGREVELPAAEGFAVSPAGLPAGPHVMSVRAVDGKGVSGKKSTVDFTVMGPTPAVTPLAITQGKQSIPFYSGMKSAVLQGTLLTGSITAGGGVKSATYSLQGGPAKPLGLRKPDKGGMPTFELPLPADLPHGRVDVAIAVTDSFDRAGELRFSLYRVEASAGEDRDTEGVFFPDPRIAAGGTMLLAPGETLAGYFNGRPVKQVAVEPAVPLAQVQAEGAFLVLTAGAEGTADGLRVRVTTVDGDTFLSDPLTLRVDAGDPRLTISSPVTGDWVAGKILLKGAASDPNGIALIEYSVGPEGAWSPLKGSKSPGGETVFETAVEVPDAPDGDLPVSLRAVDGAGRSTAVLLMVTKDTRPPAITVLTPPSADPVNGLVTLSGVVEDTGAVRSVEFSPDGRTWTLVEGTPVFRMPLDLAHAGDPAGYSIRVTDRSGNAASITPALTVEQAADLPEVQIQVPPEGDVQRGDFTISGMVFDDDGVGSITYRIDNGEPVKLPGSHSFAIPVALADITDNEHTVEVTAEDLGGVKSETRRSIFKVSTAEPVSRLESPAISTTSRGIITLGGVSTDKNGIGEVWVSFDNGQTFDRARGAEAWTYRLDTRILKDGTYTLFVKSVDAYGTEGLVATLFSVDNSAPQIILDSPADGAAVTDAFTLAGRARDNIELTSLKAVLAPLGGGRQKSVDLPLTGTFAVPVDLSGIPPGWYDLTVQGRDKAANEALTSCTVRVAERAVENRCDLWFPVDGEMLHGGFSVSGHLASSVPVAEAVLLVDGVDAGVVSVDERGFFSTAVGAEVTLADGQHTVCVEARPAGLGPTRSEARGITYSALGPWVRITSHTLGSFVTSRPFIRGEAGWKTEDAAPGGGEAAAREREARRVTRVEISLDNGRSFVPAQGSERWQYRLETQDYPDGPVRLMVKAVFAEGASAIDETMLILDHTPPQVVLLAPREEGRFNASIALTGTARDENGVAEVRAAVRTGDKSSYEVPAFIQGLYFEGRGLGATTWAFGAGLTFFDNNVKLQAEIGMAPDGRFSGLVLGGRLLANVARLPFSFLLGPDWDLLSLSFALGADFSYVTNSGSTIAFTDQGLILGAVIGQLEFPIVKIKSWPMLNTYSVYTEYQLWFISSDVSAGFVHRLAFGARVGLF